MVTAQKRVCSRQLAVVSKTGKESLQSIVGSRQQNRKKNFQFAAGGFCPIFFTANCQLQTANFSIEARLIDEYL